MEGCYRLTGQHGWKIEGGKKRVCAAVGVCSCHPPITPDLTRARVSFCLPDYTMIVCLVLSRVGKKKKSWHHHERWYEAAACVICEFGLWFVICDLPYTSCDGYILVPSHFFLTICLFFFRYVSAQLPILPSSLRDNRRYDLDSRSTHPTVFKSTYVPTYACTQVAESFSYFPSSLYPFPPCTSTFSYRPLS